MNEMSHMINNFTIESCDAFKYDTKRSQVNANFEKMNNMVNQINSRKLAEEKKEKERIEKEKQEKLKAEKEAKKAEEDAKKEKESKTESKPESESKGMDIE